MGTPREYGYKDSKGIMFTYMLEFMHSLLTYTYDLVKVYTNLLRLFYYIKSRFIVFYASLKRITKYKRIPWSYEFFIKL